ncbi:FRG1-like family-domain-containing protein [Clohesyomyces aquaticus]|uniref:FRG1-like family-domain-containing protein n=1 Tax=Clohesyomyces aquaticus TaxID=1231657 RepID=A0A1Y1ZZX3_9PLEO|nr:FRG1-like family-domain-containing protein [Clohesyomyces aquaticus]
MVKPLAFKGDKKVKKRKRAADADDGDGQPSSTAVARASGNAHGAAADDSWVTADAPTDLTGPVMIVLPTEPPTALACDANGKVFASQIENFIDGDPATAEPHDVRQVWVANQVAGTESFSLKATHGRYLGCDRSGILTANSTAISPEESFLCIPVPDNPSTFSLQTQRDKFLTVDETGSRGPEVRGDAETITFSTTFRIRMQARFKPKLRASKEEKAKEKISRKELEELAGRRLDDDEVRKLKRARRDGGFHEAVLDIKVKSSHDKFAS